MKRWPEKKTWICLSLVTILVPVLFAGNGLARPQLFGPDPISGYALAGHDPVSYFVDGYPRKGDRKHEYTWSGLDWVFVNEGNLAAFKRDPLAYAPKFGGCGAYALSEGYSTSGNPFIYAIFNGRLFFFHSVVNRFLFIVNGDVMLKEAEENAAKVGCTASG